MDRRAFLNKTTVAVATAGATAALAPRWLGERFAREGAPPIGDAPSPAPSAVDDASAAATCHALPVAARGFGDAVLRARAIGKPLLLLVVPERDRWQRGLAFGAWLQHAPPGVAAAFALVEVACATMDELRSLDASRLARHKTPMLALAWVDSDEPRVDVAYSHLPPLDSDGQVTMAVTRLNEAFASLLIGRKMRGAISEVLAESPITHATLAHLTELSRRTHACPPPALDELARVPLAEIDRHAAPISLAAQRLGPLQATRKAHVQRLLTEAARARLLLAPITDRPWAFSMGCGVRIEGEEPPGVMCGMAFVPERTQRFLHLFTSAERNEP